MLTADPSTVLRDITNGFHTTRLDEGSYTVKSMLEQTTDEVFVKTRPVEKKQVADPEQLSFNKVDPSPVKGKPSTLSKVIADSDKDVKTVRELEKQDRIAQARGVIEALDEEHEDGSLSFGDFSELRRPRVSEEDRPDVQEKAEQSPALTAAQPEEMASPNTETSDDAIAPTNLFQRILTAFHILA